MQVSLPLIVAISSTEARAAAKSAEAEEPVCIISRLLSLRPEAGAKVRRATTDRSIIFNICFVLVYVNGQSEIFVLNPLVITSQSKHSLYKSPIGI
jgi:hypothetical protein